MAPGLAARTWTHTRGRDAFQHGIGPGGQVAPPTGKARFTAAHSMTKTSPEPQPRAPADSRLRRASWALDLLLVVLLLAVAAQARLSWNDLGIDVDWTWFVESSNDLARGQAHAYVQFLYSSIPCVLFAGLIELVHDPLRLVRAWALLGALSAPLTYLAVRRVGGPFAGLAAGWIVATHYDNVITVAGIKSPYAIATWAALACLGLAAATQRRPWGVPVLVLGTALAVTHHLGLWMLTPAVVVLAGLHLWRLPWRQALVAGALTIVLGGAVLALFLGFDLTRLLGELDEYRARFGGDPSSLLTGAEVWLGLLGGRVPEPHGGRLLAGLASTPGSLRLLGAVATTGLTAALLRVAWWHKRQRGLDAPAPALAVHHALATGAQALLLLGLGSGLYLVNMVNSAYLENHHVVALVPILALAMAGLARGLAPARSGAWGALLPTAALGGWLALAHGTLLTVPAPPVNPNLLEVHSLQNAAEIGRVVRADARARGAQPGVLLWTQRSEQLSPWLLPDLANELARLDWRTEDEPTICYLVNQPGLDRHLEGGRPIPLSARARLNLRAFDDCGQLRALESPLCHDVDHTFLWRGQNFGMRPDATSFLEGVLPCVRTR